jgi:hypothetical protein
MATLDRTSGSGGVPSGGGNKVYIVKNRLDFRAVDSGGDGVATSGDVVQAISLSANTHVLKVYVKVVVPEGGTATATVGDGAGTNSWDASVNLNATAGTVTTSLEADAYGTEGKVYTMADTIDLTLGNDLDAAIVDIYALCCDLN